MLRLFFSRWEKLRFTRCFLAKTFRSYIHRICKPKPVCPNAAKAKFKMKIKNICILDTHFHMEIQPGEDENLSEIMKYIKQRYVFQLW